MNDISNPSIFHRILKRGIADIIVERDLITRLESGKSLRLKMGFDPTRPDIHMGHVVGLRKLRQMQDLGHKVILIIGDWTAQIGDPSGQSATRPMLTAEQVRANAESYMRQFFKVIDSTRAEAVWQSEWFGTFDLSNVFDLTSRFTVAQLLARDDFANRFKNNRPIAITELLYPLLQAYDSVAIKSDVEFGGSDQRFNLLVGRDLQQMMGYSPQQCIIMPILVGTDGVLKMSKSLDNYIGIEDTPRDMYGKTMSLPDEALTQYFELLTDIPSNEIEAMSKSIVEDNANPMEFKKYLAKNLVAQFHSPIAAQQAQEAFENTYQKSQMPPEDIQVISLGKWIAAWRREGTERIIPFEGIQQYSADFSKPTWLVPIVPLLLGENLVSSSSEGKRLLSQGAIQINGSKISSDKVHLQDGSIIKVGKMRFARISN